MFITKSEKESFVEISLNLGDRILKLEKEMSAIKTILKKSPSWAWVENLEKRVMVADKRFETSAKNQVKKNAEIMAAVQIMEEKIESNRKFIKDVFGEVLARDSERIDKIAFAPPEVKVEVRKPSKIARLLSRAPILEEVPVTKKKVGRPLGSKAVRPMFPPKTPFELLKPLGRPKGSKNKLK
jgi:hypothetical protein